MGRKRTESDWETHRFPREAKLQDYVIKRLKKLPEIKVIKIADRFTKGISDLLLCVRGKFVAIELKVGSNKPTKLQLYFLEEIKNAGGIVGIAYTWGGVKDILRKAGYPIDDYIEFQKATIDG